MAWKIPEEVIYFHEILDNLKSQKIVNSIVKKWFMVWPAPCSWDSKNDEDRFLVLSQLPKCIHNLTKLAEPCAVTFTTQNKIESNETTFIPTFFYTEF